MACLDSQGTELAIGDTVQDLAANNHTVDLLGHFIVKTTDSPTVYLRAKETTKQ